MPGKQASQNAVLWQETSMRASGRQQKALTIAEHVKCRGHSGFEPLLEQVFGRLTDIAIGLQKARLAVVLCQALHAEAECYSWHATQGMMKALPMSHLKHEHLIASLAKITIAPQASSLPAVARQYLHAMETSLCWGQIA